MDNVHPDRARRARVWALVAALFGFPQMASAAMPERDLWPLVKRADHAVWGTLVEIQERGSDRLLVIATLAPGRAGGEHRLPARLELLELAGLLPEGTAIWPGATGLFLYVDAEANANPTDGEAGANAAVDGILLPDSFVSGVPGTTERMAVGVLIEHARGPAPAAAADDAMALLSGSTAELRQLALGWLRERPVELEATLRTALRARFLEEGDPRVQRKYLELFVRRELPLAAGRVTPWVQEPSEPALGELTLLYLERLASLEDRAQLIAAFHEAPAAVRARLLSAYARLGLEVPVAYWQDSLRAPEAQLVTAAVENLGKARVPGAAELYASLLGSTSPTVRTLALRGLATLGTPTAIAQLRAHAERSDVDARDRALTERLLRHPYRHGATVTRPLSRDPVTRPREAGRP